MTTLPRLAPRVLLQPLSARLTGLSSVHPPISKRIQHGSLRSLGGSGASPSKLISGGMMTRSMSSGGTALKESYDYILAERRFPEGGGGGVGVITLHRPKALNALCDALFVDLIHAIQAVRCCRESQVTKCVKQQLTLGA